MKKARNEIKRQNEEHLSRVNGHIKIFNEPRARRESKSKPERQGQREKGETRPKNRPRTTMLSMGWNTQIKRQMSELTEGKRKSDVRINDSSDENKARRDEKG